MEDRCESSDDDHRSVEGMIRYRARRESCIGFQPVLCVPWEIVLGLHQSRARRVAFLFHLSDLTVQRMFLLVYLIIRLLQHQKKPNRSILTSNFHCNCEAFCEDNIRRVNKSKFLHQLSFLFNCFCRVFALLLLSIYPHSSPDSQCHKSPSVQS